MSTELVLIVVDVGYPVSLSIEYFLLCAILTEAILISGFAHHPRWEESRTMWKRTADYGGRVRNHGAPTDPDASRYSREQYGGSPSFGTHGQPTDPNASSNSGSSGLVFPGEPAGPDGGPPPSPSFGPHGQPTDPNASSNSEYGGYPGGYGGLGPHGQPTDPNASSNSGSSSGLVFPGEPAGPDGGPPPPPSFGPHGQPTDPNASSNNEYSGYPGQYGGLGPHGQPTDPNNSKYSRGRRQLRRYQGQPTDPNASRYSEQFGSPGPIGTHGAPTDPNASMYGGPYGSPDSIGTHGAPTDPNASINSYRR